jgi:hypothetical protein
MNPYNERSLDISSVSFFSSCLMKSGNAVSLETLRGNNPHDFDDLFGSAFKTSFLIARCTGCRETPSFFAASVMV